jgi:hypothetical protein
MPQTFLSLFLFILSLQRSQRSEGFVFDTRANRAFLARWICAVTPHAPSPSALSAKKKASAAALEALEALEKTIEADDSEESSRTLSKKEMLKLQKQQHKSTPAENRAVSANKKLSKKEQLLARALEMEEFDEPGKTVASEESTGMSKRELKALKKQQPVCSSDVESRGDDAGGDLSASKANGVLHANGEGRANAIIYDGDSSEAVDPSLPTLEDKVRKERPPPRIRVMESSQPGYTSLRLENVGIIFRNQEVLKQVTWGVSTGDRIGLGKFSSDAEFNQGRCQEVLA